ncbi:MAG: hypothetical protein V3V78_00470 [Candidatus Woesearchaeota archaeon]
MNSTTTSSEAEMADLWFCTICKKKGHTAIHHRQHPDIYGEMEFIGEAISDFQATRNFDKEKDLTKFNPRVFDTVHLNNHIQACYLKKLKVREAIDEFPDFIQGWNIKHLKEDLKKKVGI